MYTPTHTGSLVQLHACIIKFIILCFFMVPRDSYSLEIHSALLHGEENKPVERINSGQPGIYTLLSMQRSGGRLIGPSILKRSPLFYSQQNY